MKIQQTMTIIENTTNKCSQKEVGYIKVGFFKGKDRNISLNIITHKNGSKISIFFYESITEKNNLYELQVPTKTGWNWKTHIKSTIKKIEERSQCQFYTVEEASNIKSEINNNDIFEDTIKEEKRNYYIEGGIFKRYPN